MTKNNKKHDELQVVINQKQLDVNKKSEELAAAEGQLYNLRDSVRKAQDDVNHLQSRYDQQLFEN